MELKRTKPYKARDPEDTIFLIRKILHEKLNIVLKEEHTKGDEQFYSCRITIANKHIGGLRIGTNGKGMKFEYALASAYGEFMERLQNQILIVCRQILNEYNVDQHKNSVLYRELYKQKLIPKYKFAPDEENIIFDKERSSNCIRKYVKSFDIEEIEHLYHGKALSLLPYVNVFEQKVEYLPVNIIFANCASNGMCAGNTPYEALIQGLSEVLERYVLRMLYYKNLTFPTIQEDHFFDTEVYTKIQQIRNKYKWTFEIKDCSCDLGIPAIGILIIDRVNMCYRFHIGVDPSPITALERALTEIYQGMSHIRFKDIDWNIQNKLLSDMGLKKREMLHTCVSGSGHFPISIFGSTPSYTFKAFDSAWGKSDTSDINLIFDIFKKIENPVYIRDVSFLGFPAFSVYVPGMSELKNLTNNEDLKNLSKLRRSYLKCRDLRNADKHTLKEIVNYVKMDDSVNNPRFYNLRDIWYYHNKDLLLSLLLYSSGSFEEAIENIEKYVSNTELDSKEKKFFSCIVCLIQNKINEINDDLLNDIYGPDLVSLCKSFLDNKNYLKFIKSSSCYDCNKCEIKNTCKIVDSFALLKEIENIYMKNIPKQDELKDILKF